MKKGWTTVSLGEVLTLDIDAVEVDPGRSYPFAGVYGFGRGLFSRDPVNGSETSYKRFHRLHNNQLVMSQPKGWEGALAVVPHEFDGRFVSGVYPTFKTNAKYLSPGYLRNLVKCRWLWNALLAKSTGIGARRNSVYPAHLFEIEIPLPPLAEQERIVARLDAIESRLARVRKLRELQEQELTAALRSAFHEIKNNSDWATMDEVAPLVRRPVEIEPDGRYPELGIRSFGRGTFHKPAVLGIETTKRLFEIHEGDLLFSNVFAWEGAVAVAQKEDHGRVGSHRFITCRCDESLIMPELLQFYFLTTEGLERLGQASPGGAGRNRTLGLKKLARILVPIPTIKLQRDFKSLLDLQSKLQAEADLSAESHDVLLPSLLDRVFGGGLAVSN